MNVKIGTEAALPEKEYINGVFVAVYRTGPQGYIGWTVDTVPAYVL